MTAALAGLLTAALIMGAATARPILVIAVVLVEGACLGRWFAALEVPGAAVGTTLVVGTGLAADVAVLATDEARPMGHVPAVLGIALLGSLAVQLFRRNGRADLTAWLIATGAGLVMAACGSAWLALQTVDGHLVLIAAIAAGVVPLLDTAVPGWLAVVGSLVVAGGAGLAVAAGTDLAVWPALGCAGAAAVAARVSAVFAGRAAPTPPLTAALPLVLAAPAAYLMGRILVG